MRILVVVALVFSSCSQDTFSPRVTFDESIADSLKHYIDLRDYDGATRLVSAEDAVYLPSRAKALYLTALASDGFSSKAKEEAQLWTDSDESNAWSWYARARSAFSYGSLGGIEGADSLVDFASNRALALNDSSLAIGILKL